jgi:hypothetical protein
VELGWCGTAVGGTAAVPAGGLLPVVAVAPTDRG